ncbi:MAG: hypothetical protein CFH25_00246 [Alphaproteobacteria bacterium MarineAlpha6_Bin3]|nr:MAG: hypothetical protein CFH25_00246 [Alphaproteobacteria bacterium MarineAlpha6_Bin3]|tara:strand:+ start:1443 stop:1841 length:399 start_codon:yes stop_codon:yes gene_type:complete
MSLKKKTKQINLIPLINVIFLMLIFFMLAGTITKIDPHKINIPESIIKNDPLTPFLTIIVKKNGNVFVDSKNRKKDLQEKNYIEILRSRKPKEISLKIDSETPSEYFLEILKVLENENIKKVVIETVYIAKK